MTNPLYQHCGIEPQLSLITERPIQGEPKKQTHWQLRCPCCGKCIEDSDSFELIRQWIADNEKVLT